MTRYTKRNGLSRRTLLKSGVAAAAGTLAAPMVWAQSNIILRQAGTGVSAFNEIADKAFDDLGITMETVSYTHLTLPTTPYV